MARVRWKVYYSNGGTFSDRDGGPQDAPGHGVVLIAQADPIAGRDTPSGEDYYCWDVRDEVWVARNYQGLLQYLGQPGWKVVLQGEMVPRVRWQKIWNQMKDDFEAPPRTGYD